MILDQTISFGGEKMIFVVPKCVFMTILGSKMEILKILSFFFEIIFFFQKLFLTRHLIPMVLGGENCQKGPKS